MSLWEQKTGSTTRTRKSCRVCSVHRSIVPPCVARASCRFSAAPPLLRSAALNELLWALPVGHFCSVPRGRRSHVGQPHQSAARREDADERCEKHHEEARLEPRAWPERRVRLEPQVRLEPRAQMEGRALRCAGRRSEFAGSWFAEADRLHHYVVAVSDRWTARLSGRHGNQLPRTSLVLIPDLRY